MDDQRPPFWVSLYNAADEMIASVGMGALPYPGLLLAHPSGVWRVEQIQVFVTDFSPTATPRPAASTMVDVMVTPTEGIHHG